MKTKQQDLLKIIIILLVCLCLFSGGLYFFQRSLPRDSWILQKDTYYYRDSQGKKVSGWQELGGNTYYFGKGKAMATGWQQLEGGTCYFGGDGRLRRSWQTIDGSTYYFDENGFLVTGWLETGLGKYYFNPDGTACSGWLKSGGSTYYMTDMGKAHTGPLEEKGKWYCFGPDGTLQTGWFSWGEDTYYCKADGTAQTGDVTIEGVAYRFRKDGRLFTGWEDTEEGRRYYDSKGQLVTGWQQIDGKRYFFGDNHLMLTGWYQEGEYSYYLQQDGSAAVGPLEIDKQMYYFSPQGIHVVLVNRQNAVPAYYETKKEVYPPWHEVAQPAYEPLLRMLADLEAAGYTFEFNSAYRSIQGQRAVLDYYMEQYLDQGYDWDTAMAECLTFVAPPGHSEHHLGLAVDILNVEEEAPCLEWLHEYCWDYGFILRYTKEKEDITGYIDEPWHFRYVGTEISLDMKDSGLCLEEYLGAA